MCRNQKLVRVIIRLLKITDYLDSLDAQSNEARKHDIKLGTTLQCFLTNAILVGTGS